MKTYRPLLLMMLLLCGLTWQLGAAAQSKPLPAATQYSDEGADTCLGCHDEDEGRYKAKALFKTKHAHRGDKRAPFGAGGLQCEACHGPGALHARNKKGAAINSFKPDSKFSLEERNQVCLTCHQGGSRSAWHAGAHDRAQLACTDCHQIHQERDAVLVKATEAAVCQSCHKAQKADFLKASAHPVRQGKMACSDCHSAHGSSAPAMLIKPTLNQTCYGCHADKRGPLLWEHAPVAEDCASCHAPHGSVRTALLTKSPPLLCQQCHTSAGHPSVARTGDALPGGTAGGTGFLIAGSCTNCHTQVHGSNHPAGAKLMR
ncbi:MAG: cystathionine beta-synthase [Leptothrix sp. (in: Bacteria)]|nr:cystathionine beta-synthase [Leptothrix sp. (in: b-proteobacteria)]